MTHQQHIIELYEKLTVTKLFTATNPSNFLCLHMDSIFSYVRHALTVKRIEQRKNVTTKSDAVIIFVRPLGFDNFLDGIIFAQVISQIT